MKRSSTNRRIQRPRLREAGLRSERLVDSRGRRVFRERHGVGIEAMENFEKIGGAEGEAHASDIFLDEFLRVDGDDFAAGVEEWTAAVRPDCRWPNVFALADAGGVGKGEMRKVTLAGGAFDFGEGDVEIGINVKDFGFELLAVGEKREQGFFAAGEMGIGDDDAGTGNEEA